jgi:hypothetical protein
MQGIIDHITDGHAVAPADMYIKHGRNKKVRKTTKGWHLCVEWKYGTTSLESLADLKESNPIEVVEYAATKSLLDTPGFIWWAPHVLKKCTIIIVALIKRYQKRTHQFGIEVPKSWDDCVRLEKENVNTLWQDAVRKEMKNVRIAFKILSGEESMLIPQVRLAHKYPISPLGDDSPPLGEIIQYVFNLTWLTRLFVTSHSQPLINTKYKVLVTNYLQTIY